MNHSLVLLKAMLEAAVDWGYLPHNPARKVRKLKIGRADPHIWTIGEIRRLLLNTGDNWRPLFLVALFTGLRLGEIQALAWDRQNRPMFATRKIEVRAAYNERTGVLGRPKSEAALRAVDMVPTVYHALLELWSGTASGLVFPGPAGKPLPAWMLYDHGFRPAIKRAKVNGIRFHDLRHTYASLLIMAGKHPKYIADQMGHASAAFTLDTYGHLMGRLPVQPVEWIDDLVFPEGLEAAVISESTAPVNRLLLSCNSSVILSPLNRSVKMSSPLEQKYSGHDRGDDHLDPTGPEPAGGTERPGALCHADAGGR